MNTLLTNLSSMLNLSTDYTSPGLTALKAQAQKNSDGLVAAAPKLPSSPLAPFFDGNYTDKDTIHSYLPVYSELLKPVWDKPFRLLEVGIQRGGSLAGWCKAFPKASIYGVDCQKTVKITAPNYTEVITNAYDEDFLQMFATQECFDFIVEDGSHAYNDIMFACKNYIRLLKPGGVLVIEDIPDVAWLPKFKAVITAQGCLSQVVDLRDKKGRWDDVLFLIKKPNM